MAFLDFFVYNNEVWFIDFFSGELCCYSLTEQRILSVVCLPHVGNKENYRAIYIVNDKVYIAPLFAENLIVYDIYSNRMESISLKRSIRDERPNYLEIIKNDDSLYLLPMDAKNIVRVDINNNQTEFFDITLHENDREAFSDRHFFNKGCFVNGIIYLPSCRQNKILCFDINTRVFRWADVQDDSLDGFRSCSYAEGHFVLITHDGNQAIFLNDNFDLSSSLEVKDKSINSVDVSLHDKIFHIGCESDGIVEVIDTCKRKITPHMFDLGRNNLLPTNNFVFAAKVNENELWLFSSSQQALCIFDEYGKQIEKYAICVNEECKRLLLKGRIRKLFADRQYKDKEIIEETTFYPLDVFMGTLIYEGED